jgi:hypothetical protein
MRYFFSMNLMLLLQLQRLYTSKCDNYELYTKKDLKGSGMVYFKAFPYIWLTKIWTGDILSIEKEC